MINFRKRGYDLFWALQGIDLTINKGETMSIIGPNGSGKSTLLRIMTRIMSPTEGKIATHGTIAALLELGAGFHPDLTGRENIYLNASILGFKRRMIAGIIDEIVAFSELGPFVENQVKNYSTGMYVRLGFSVAINVNPDILLVDEVLAVGDEAFQTKCLNRIARMQQEGKTIVLVTHSAGIAESISDRVLWLEKGVQKMLGDPHEVIDSYHEAMRQHPEGSEFGTRDIVINRVELLDGEGKEAEEFETGRLPDPAHALRGRETRGRPGLRLRVLRPHGLHGLRHQHPPARHRYRARGRQELHGLPRPLPGPAGREVLRIRGRALQGRHDKLPLAG